MWCMVDFVLVAIYLKTYTAIVRRYPKVLYRLSRGLSTAHGVSEIGKRVMGNLRDKSPNGLNYGV